MKEMIEKYKQEMPEEEFADFEDIKRGEGKFIVSQLERLLTFLDAIASLEFGYESN